MKPKVAIVAGLFFAIVLFLYYAFNQHRPPPKDMLAQISGFRDRMCACADAACRDAVGKQLTAWMQSLSGSSPEEADATKFNDVSNEMTKCMSGSAGVALPSGMTTPGHGSN